METNELWPLTSPHETSASEDVLQPDQPGCSSQTGRDSLWWHLDLGRESMKYMKSFVAKTGHIHFCQFEIFAIEAAEI